MLNSGYTFLFFCNLSSSVILYIRSNSVFLPYASFISSTCPFSCSELFEFHRFILRDIGAKPLWICLSRSYGICDGTLFGYLFSYFLFFKMVSNSETGFLILSRTTFLISLHPSVMARVALVKGLS